MNYVIRDTPDAQWPEAVRKLRSLPSVATFHDQWGTRQPIGMYNVSLATLPRLFNGVLDSLQELAETPLSGGGQASEKVVTRLIDAHKSLLYAMYEHVEDCDNITKLFFAKDSFTGKEAPIKIFRQSIRPYRDRLGRVVNAMKHRQARLGMFHAVNSIIRIPGYSVQVVVAPNTIGADALVHPKKNHGDVAATSFSHDLRWLFCAMYAVGKHLAEFIEANIKSTEVLPGAIDVPQSPLKQNEQKILRPTPFEVANRISRLSAFVYPQETRSAIPIVELGEKSQAIRLEISSDAKPKPLTFGQLPGGQVRLIATYFGDGATTSFNVP